MFDSKFEGRTPTSQLPTSLILELLCDGVEINDPSPYATVAEAEFWVVERLKIELTARSIEGNL